MDSVHELFTHLQKTHRTSVTQYYASLGDRTVVRFGTDRTLAAVAIPKKGQLELFLLVRFRISDATDACWVWYVGDSAAAGTYHVRLESGRSKWRGVAQSLESSQKEVMLMAGDGETTEASKYLCVEAAVSSIVVEIK